MEIILFNRSKTVNYYACIHCMKMSKKNQCWRLMQIMHNYALYIKLHGQIEALALTPQEDSEIPTANSRRGTFAPQKALNGTSYFNNYYITPLSLFFTTTPDEVGLVGCLVGFLTSSSTARLYRGRAPRQSV